MRPLKRSSVDKARFARRFRREAGRTKRINVAAPMRGGIRL